MERYAGIVIKMKIKIIVTVMAISLLLVLSGCGPSLDEFAKCVTKSGMSLYGTYWCPHCQNMKKSFGNSLKYINYIECDDKHPKGNAEKCRQDGIEGYPTFIFGDGMRLSGEMSLELIADKTKCKLPK